MIHGRQGACALALAAVFAVGGSASTTGAAQAAPASTTVVAATTAKAKPLRVTAKPSTVRIVSGQTLTVTGKVTNADPSTRVVLQTRTEDGWANLGRPAALSRGSFKLTTRPAAVGPQAFRVVARYDAAPLNPEAVTIISNVA